MLERFLLIWLLLSSGGAYLWPEMVETTKPALPWLITVTMFSIGMMLPRDGLSPLAGGLWRNGGAVCRDAAAGLWCGESVPAD